MTNNDNSEKRDLGVETVTTTLLLPSVEGTDSNLPDHSSDVQGLTAPILAAAEENEREVDMESMLPPTFQQSATKNKIGQSMTALAAKKFLAKVKKLPSPIVGPSLDEDDSIKQMKAVMERYNSVSLQAAEEQDKNSTKKGNAMNVKLVFDAARRNSFSVEGKMIKMQADVADVRAEVLLDYENLILLSQRACPSNHGFPKLANLNRIMLQSFRKRNQFQQLVGEPQIPSQGLPVCTIVVEPDQASGLVKVSLRFRN